VSNCFAVYPFGFWRDALEALGFYRKAKSLERFGKEREKNMKKTLSRRKGCLEVCLAGKNIYISISLESL